MDGGFVGVADVAGIMGHVGVADSHRLIGGLAVMLHVQRLGLDLPLRATGDSDFGVAPYILRDGTLITQIEALGYQRVAGNRWERALNERRVAAVDLLVPAYTSRARSNVTVGDVVTTEVPGLAYALREPPVEVDVELVLTDQSVRSTRLVLPNAQSTLVLKTFARTVRTEQRDSEDLWRSLEICHAEGVGPRDFDQGVLEQLRTALWHDFGEGGTAVAAVTAGLQQAATAQLRTRLRALVLEVVGLEN